MIDRTNKIKLDSLSLFKYNVSYFRFVKKGRYPVGASGTRILVTLISALRKYNKTRGVASLCIGGGEATAMAVEVLS